MVVIINAQSTVQREHDSGKASGWHVSGHDVGSSPVHPVHPVQYLWDTGRSVNATEH